LACLSAIFGSLKLSEQWPPEIISYAQINQLNQDGKLQSNKTSTVTKLVAKVGEENKIVINFCGPNQLTCHFSTSCSRRPKNNKFAVPAYFRQF
jgi:hypothetical protein